MDIIEVEVLAVAAARLGFFLIISVRYNLV